MEFRSELMHSGRLRAHVHTRHDDIKINRNNVIGVTDINGFLFETGSTCERFTAAICIPDERRINVEDSIAHTMRSKGVQAALYFRENLRAIAESACRHGTFAAFRDENLNAF